MAKAKKSKKSKKSLGLFIFATLMFLLFLALAIGLSLRPYSTITPYTYESENTKISVTINPDNTMNIDAQVGSLSFNKEGYEASSNLDEFFTNLNENGQIDAFKYQFNLDLPIVGKITSAECKNIGNEAIVGVCAALSAIFLGVALASTKKAF